METGPRSKILSRTEVVRNLEVSPYPEHLGGDRLLMVLDILDHEKKKAPGQNVAGIEEGRKNTHDKLVAPESRHTELRDIYNRAYADMEVAKLKGGFIENMSAENVKVSEEKLAIKDLCFMPYFIRNILKIEGAPELMNGQQVLQYYQQPEHHQALLDLRALSDESFGGENIPREEDNILTTLAKNGQFIVYDGNGRFIRKLSKFILEEKPIGDAKIISWVFRGDGNYLRNFWVPTSQLANLLQKSVENPTLRESAKVFLGDLYKKSPLCVNLELDRAVQMFEYKPGDNSVSDFVTELRKDWHIQ